MLHPRDVHPFLPLLVVYTCSAMTHILEDIREDALAFLDLWVAAGGQMVVNGFWDKVPINLKVATDSFILSLWTQH